MIKAKNDALKILSQRIKISESKLRKIERQQRSINKKISSRKIMEAGRIFELAGIMENYDYDFILGLLASLKKLNISDVVYRQLKNTGMDIRLQTIKKDR